MNNPLSYSFIKLDLFSKDNIQLESASGFVIEADEQYYIITNRHVAGEPYTLKTSVHIYSGVGETKHPLSMGIRKRMTIPLYDENDKPKWIEHRMNEQHQPLIDIIALPIQLDQFLRPASTRIPGIQIQPIANPWIAPQPEGSCPKAGQATVREPALDDRADPPVGRPNGTTTAEAIATESQTTG